MNPIITGGEVPGSLDKIGKLFYKPGDLLNLTCTSAPSNPPATLEWRINGLKVRATFAKPFRQLKKAQQFNIALLL